MKDVFHSRGFKSLVISAFAMLCFLLYTAGADDRFASNALGAVTTPMSRVSTLVTNNAAVAAGSVTRSNEELEAENAELKKQVDQLNKKLVDFYTYQQENAQLKKFLQLKNENPDYKLVSAAVIGRDPANLFYQFTIDQGTLSGIAVNDPVVTESGVAGWISSASASFSRVTTLFSPNTKISAMDKVSRETGVIGCDIKLADRGILKLGYLTSGTTVKEGDIVVSNGLGGVYPRNLPIGTVRTVGNDAYDVSLYAEVEPFVDVKTVRDVMVITSFQGQGQALDDSSKTSEDS